MLEEDGEDSGTPRKRKIALGFWVSWLLITIPYQIYDLIRGVGKISATFFDDARNESWL
ncbi:MAG: hypothetical protein ACXACD_19080 [Candidatus Thorarchaeota archaeon]